MDKYKWVSIGYNCFMRICIDRSNILKPMTNFFDYLGTPMWAVHQLIQNDFPSDFFDQTMYKNMFMFKDRKNVMHTNRIYTHSKYMIRVAHDLPNYNDPSPPFPQLEFDAFVLKYKRRIPRFKQLLEQTRFPLLFFRYQEPLENHDIPTEHEHYYDVPEDQQMERFDQMLQQKYPSLRYKILYFQTDVEDQVRGNVIYCKRTTRLEFPTIFEDLTIMMNHKKSFFEQFL